MGEYVVFFVGAGVWFLVVGVWFCVSVLTLVCVAAQTVGPEFCTPMYEYHRFGSLLNARVCTIALSLRHCVLHSV